MKNDTKNILKDNLLKIPSTDFTARTMRIIHEMQAEQPVKRKIRGWFFLSPLAAVVVFVLLLTFFLPWGSPSTISWAEVQQQLKQVQTLSMRFNIEIITPTSNIVWHSMKILVKDPGRFRCEIYDPEGEFDPLSEPQWISILRSEPGLIKGLTLHPDSHWAEMWSEIFHTYGQEPSTTNIGRIFHRQNLNYALESWNKMKRVTVDDTKRIGNRVINGKPAVGFVFDVSAQELGLDDCEQVNIPEKIWVDRDDGVPLLTELEFKTHLGKKLRLVALDIQWNVPLDESLFDATVPAGWGISRHLDKSIEYTDIRLSPSVSIEIGPNEQSALVDAGDVAWVLKTEQTSDPDYAPECTGIVTIELTPGAAKRLRNYAKSQPDNPIVVNFNGEITAPAKLSRVHPTQVSFDITQLCLPMFRMEEKYTTAALQKRTS
jgi:outer membrane lipoprotein-sorting protein